MTCPYVIAWHGACGCPTVTDREFCGQHLGVHCAGCRRQAVEECGFAGSFVCGAPLCDECEHSPHGGHGPKRYTLAEAREKLGIEDPPFGRTK